MRETRETGKLFPWETGKQQFWKLEGNKETGKQRFSKLQGNRSFPQNLEHWVKKFDGPAKTGQDRPFSVPPVEMRVFAATSEL